MEIQGLQSSNKIAPETNSPLTVIPSSLYVETYLFYVDTQDLLASAVVAFQSGRECCTNVINGSYPVLANSRNLNASLIFADKWVLAVVVFYESPSGNVAAFKFSMTTVENSKGGRRERGR